MTQPQSVRSPLPLPLKILGGLAILLTVCILGALIHLLVAVPEHPMRHVQQEAPAFVKQVSTTEYPGETTHPVPEEQTTVREVEIVLAETTAAQPVGGTKDLNQDLMKIEAEIAADKLRMEKDIAALDKVTVQVRQLQHTIDESKKRNQQYAALVTRLEQLEAEARAPASAEQSAKLRQEIRAAQAAAAAAVAEHAQDKTLTPAQESRIKELIAIEREELRHAE